MNAHQRVPFACAAVIAALVACSGDPTSTNGKAPHVHVVKRGALRITITEDAEIQAAKETRVKSQVEGQSTIIYLIPEGTVVKEGDKLVEVDASELVDRRQNQAISVTKAKNALVQAEKNFDILQKELDAERSTAESKRRIAEMELEKFVGRRQSAAMLAANGDSEQGTGTNADMVKKLDELVFADPEADAEPQLTLSNAGEQLVGIAEATDIGTESAPVIQDRVLVEQVDPRNFAELIDKVHELLDIGNDDPAGPQSALDRDMGDMANQILQQIDEIRLNQADLKIQEDTYDHSLRLRSKLYITQNQLDGDSLTYQRKASQVNLAWHKLDLLINYELLKEKIELQQNLTNSELELERVIASNDARKAREKADLDSSREETDLAQERLDNLIKQVENAVIYAPGPGLVVYSQVGDGRRSEMIEEGISVRERQTMLILPDTTKMIANLKVQEADINKVGTGQRAVVTTDAYGGQTFLGRVIRVAPLADSGSRWSNNDRKVYKTTVALDGVNEGQKLRPNMKASCEIVIDQLEDVLTVPMPAIQRDRAVTYVWKISGKNAIAQRIEIGRNNSKEVEVVDGLQEGDRIYKAPPEGAKPPTFDQPAKAVVDPVDPSEVKPAQPDNGDDATKPMSRADILKVSREVRDYLISRFPDRKDELSGERGAYMVFRDEELQEALAENEELNARFEAMRAAAMQQMQRGGGRGMPGGERGGPGGGRGERGGPGGERGGSGGERGGNRGRNRMPGEGR